MQNQSSSGKISNFTSDVVHFTRAGREDIRHSKLNRPAVPAVRIGPETVLITGASAGIGEGLARLFAADGSRLILVARNAERLNRLAAELRALHGVEHVVIPLDLGVADSARTLFDELERRKLAVDVLVNNAGFGHNDCFHLISIQEQLQMVQLNIATMMQLTHLILPQMLARRQGAILNLGSTASFQPGPYSAVYFATKAFVLSFTEALWEEVREHQIAVTCLCPGPTQTEFGARAGMNENWNFVHASMSAEAVCRIGYRGFRQKKRIIIPGLINQILTFSVRISPRRFILRLMRWWQRPRHTGTRTSSSFTNSPLQVDRVSRCD